MQQLVSLGRNVWIKDLPAVLASLAKDIARVKAAR
jgi:hypothetical protein